MKYRSVRDPNDIPRIQEQNMADALGIPVETITQVFDRMEWHHRSGAVLVLGRVKTNPEALDWMERNDWL